MAILVTPFHMVLTEIVESPMPFTQVELDRASQYINQNFRGKKILVVRDFLLQELPKYRLKYEDSLDKLLDLVKATSTGERESTGSSSRGRPGSSTRPSSSTWRS